MAQNMARVGIPQQQYTNQMNAINHNQAGALGAVSRSANPGAGIAGIVRAGNDATGNLNAQDAQARQANQRFAIGQNSVMANQQLQKQQYNNFDRYTENFNQAAAYRGAADQNLNSAFNGAAGLTSSLYGAGQMGRLGASGMTMGQVNNNPNIPQSHNAMGAYGPTLPGYGFGNNQNYPIGGANWKTF